MIGDQMSNLIYVYGLHGAIGDFYKTAFDSDGELDFNKLVPRPFIYDGHENEREWNVANWGTEANAEIQDKDDVAPDFSEDNWGFSFYTESSPPMPIYK